jgi:phage terminase Nu1 subunit (DNA packaging protein)
MPRASNGKLVSKSELCLFWGVTAPTIDAWVGKGMPVAEKGGRGKPYKFNSAVCFDWRIEHERELLSQAAQHSPTADLNNEINRHKLRKAKLDADLAEGRALPAEEVIAGWEAVVALFKRRIRAIPSKIAPRLSAVKTTVERQAIVSAELDNALTELSEAEPVEVRESDDTFDGDLFGYDGEAEAAGQSVGPNGKGSAPVAKGGKAAGAANGVAVG